MLRNFAWVRFCCHIAAKVFNFNKRFVLNFTNLQDFFAVEETTKWHSLVVFNRMHLSNTVKAILYMSESSWSCLPAAVSACNVARNTRPNRLGRGCTLQAAIKRSSHADLVASFPLCYSVVARINNWLSWIGRVLHKTTCVHFHTDRKASVSSHQLTITVRKKRCARC